MVQKIVSNVMDFDMHNLFSPRPLLEEMEDAASGAYEILPRKTLRERHYQSQPLMIRPDYSGDFLEKLEEPYEGKLVEVEAADEENLKDFTMPSEWLKHQERVHPRVNLDEFYDYNRPGDFAGYEDLKQYWDRGWEETEAPEISEDKWLRMWLIPETNRMARRVLARYLSVDNIKTAKKLSDLMKAKIHGTKDLKTDVTVTIKAKNPKLGLWIFNTGGPGGPPKVYNKVIKKPYTSVIQFKPKGNITDKDKLDVLVSCTCPSWLFYGAQYHAVMGDYLYGPVRPVFAFPKVRDPSGNFYICKHVLACIRFLEELDERVIEIPKILRERVRRKIIKPIKVEKPYEEVVKVPPHLLPIRDRSKIKEIISVWEKSSPKVREKMINRLTDPDEVTFFAYEYPSTATSFVIKRLKELEKKSSHPEKIRELEAEVDALVGMPPHKEVAIPAELKHFEEDQSYQNNLEALDKKPVSARSRFIMSQNDPDALGYIYIRAWNNMDDHSRSYALHKLKTLVMQSKDPEVRKKAEHWIHFIAGGK